MHTKLFIIVASFTVCIHIQAQTFFKTIGGTNLDAGIIAKQTGNSGYIAAGSTFSFGNGDENIYMIRMNNTGDVLWSKAIGTKADEKPVSLELTADNGYLITASNLIIKLNAAGNVQISGKPSTASIKAGTACQLTNGGFIIAGSEGGNTANRQIYAAKLASNGTLIWKRAISASLLSNYNVVDVKEAWDGCYYILANAQITSTTSYTTLLCKINPAGKYLWCRIYKPPVYASSYTWGGLSLMRTDDKRLLINTHLSYGGNHQFMVINTDTSGMPLTAAKMLYDPWQAHQYYKQSSLQVTDKFFGFHASLTDDKGFIMAEENFDSNDFDAGIYKYDSLGRNCINNLREDGLNFITDTAGIYTAALTYPSSTGGFINVAVKQFNGGIIKENCSTALPLPSEKKYSSVNAGTNPLIVYPNPAVDLYTISFVSNITAKGSVQIFNDNGVCIQSEKIDITKSINKKQFDAIRLLSGYYMIIVKYNDITLKGPLIKL